MGSETEPRASTTASAARRSSSSARASSMRCPNRNSTSGMARAAISASSSARGRRSSEIACRKAPPAASRASMTLHAKPRRRRNHAADSPAGPAPTTATRRPFTGGRTGGAGGPEASARRAAAWCIAAMATGASWAPRRHPFSHGAGQTRPRTPGMTRSRRAIAYASPQRPAEASRSRNGMSMPAGQIRRHGASQSPTCSLNRRARLPRRACRTSSPAVSISMPSSAGCEQAGRKAPVTLFRTRQTMQEVWWGSPEPWQRVGISTPSRAAASSTVAPSGASTSLPSMVRRGMRNSSTRWRRDGLLRRAGR